MDAPLERVVPQAGGDMPETALLLQEMRALRDEMHGLRVMLVEFKGEANVIKAEMAHLEADLAALKAKVEAQDTAIAALKAAPGTTALRWSEAIGVAVVIAMIVAAGGTLWMLRASAAPVPGAGSAATAPTHPLPSRSPGRS